MIIIQAIFNTVRLPMEKNHIEIEKKYVIEKPKPEELSAMPCYSKSEILQIYLSSPRGITRRIRRRIFSDRTEYTETVKVRIDSMSANEDEREISAERFCELESQIADGSRPLDKVRHTFVYDGHVFEIDVYPEWESTSILETELASREESVAFPEIIKVVREVTGDKRYSNASMSRDFPAEDHL